MQRQQQHRLLPGRCKKQDIYIKDTQIQDTRYVYELAEFPQKEAKCKFFPTLSIFKAIFCAELVQAPPGGKFEAAAATATATAVAVAAENEWEFREKLGNSSEMLMENFNHS